MGVIYKMSILQQQQENELTWEFENVIPIYRNGEIVKYSTSLSAGQLSELYSNLDILEYNPNVQRGMKITAKGEMPISQTAKINQIKYTMQTGTLHGSMITLCVPKIDDEENIKYDENEQKLNGTGKIWILDGYHRIFACMKATKEYLKNRKKEGIFDPYSYNFPVVIEHMIEDNAKQLFSEYANTILKISRSRSDFLDIASYSNLISRKIMNEAFEGRVECVTSTLKGKTNNNVTTFSTLNSAINDSGYKPLTKGEAIKYADFLVNCFLELVEMYPKYLGNVPVDIRQSLRKKDLILEPIMFYGYISAFTKMYEKQIPNWKELIHKLDEDIQMDGFYGKIIEKDAKVWEQIFRIKNGEKLIINNSSTRKYVSRELMKFLLGEEVKGE